MDDGGGTTRPARVAPPRYDIDAALADGRAPTPFPTIGLGGGGDLLTGDAGAPRLAPPPRPASRAVRHEDALQAEIDKLLAKQQEAERAKAEATKERVPSEKHTVELGPRPESMDGRRRRAGDPENRPVHVAYELLGPATGVRVVVTPRTRKGKDKARDIAEQLVLRFSARVLTWDRPNCGASGITFEGYGSEAELQSDFLHLLLEHTRFGPAMLYGEGLGGRLSLLHALRYPQDVAALVLDSLPAGPAAARYYARKFYLEYIDILGIYNKYGMEYVAKEKHYAALCAADATPAGATGGGSNLKRLMETDVAVFKAVMKRWAAALDAHDPWLYPVLGVEAARLRAIAAPALCCHSWPSRREVDDIHTLAAMKALARALPGCAAKEPLTGFAKGTLDPAIGAFLNGLKRPLCGHALRPAAAAAAETVAATAGAMAMSALRVPARAPRSLTGSRLGRFDACCATAQVVPPGEGCTGGHSFDAWLRNPGGTSPASAAARQDRRAAPAGPCRTM